MVTYSDLFTFVIMLCAIITLVVTLRHKKQHPRSGKLRCYSCNTFYLPAARYHLAFGSLVKYIICNVYIFFNYKIKTPLVQVPETSTVLQNDTQP